MSTAPAFTCYDPFVFDPNYTVTNTDPCQLPCLANIFSDPGVYKQVWPTELTINWVSFFMMLFMISTWIIFPPKRKYPERLVLFFSCSALFISFEGVIGSFYTEREFLCRDDFHYVNQTTGAPCTASGKNRSFGCNWMISLENSKLLHLQSL